MHQDHVPTVPESFHVLGSTSICPNQGFVKFIPSADNDTADNDTSSSDLISPQSIAILTFQGHPEFTSGLVNNHMVLLPIPLVVATSPRQLYPNGRTWERIVAMTGQPNTAPPKLEK